MRSFSPLALAALAAILCSAPRLQAQEWSPPSRQMPSMPTQAQLQGDWRSAAGAWFAGVDRISGVGLGEMRAAGESPGSGGRVRFVRFSGGVRQAATWADRNGDGRCDLVEIFRSGAVAVQLIDPDYDGTADVIRVYDASGALARESRL
ncbi:MAG TPA: hypothetical protein VFX98_03565 [Longimicrobiaceae bacterium]|nr:hypothetical protein [Longimicrobiaceae bacterium]